MKVFIFMRNIQYNGDYRFGDTRCIVQPCFTNIRGNHALQGSPVVRTLDSFRDKSGSNPHDIANLSVSPKSVIPLQQNVQNPCTYTRTSLYAFIRSIYFIFLFLSFGFFISITTFVSLFHYPYLSKRKISRLCCKTMYFIITCFFNP